MTDPRTQAYLRELRIRLEKQKQDAINTAAELCDCPDCVDARVRKQIPPCEQNRIMQELHDRIIPPYSSNFIPEASPNWNPNTGMLESNSRPVRMFEPNTNSSGPTTAFKFDIKYKKD